MKFIKLLGQLFFYILIVLNLIFVVVLLKIASTFFYEQFLYKIFLIGDIFSILDLGEFVNIIVFAILGMGFGLATGLLPKYAQIKTSATLLTIVVPLIFLTSPYVRYTFWVEDFSIQEAMSYDKAESLTNSFLSKKVGIDGFLGFYLYSGQFPVLPTNQDELRKAEDIEKRVKAEFSIVTKIVKVKPEVVSIVLACANWVIRFFYFSLAVLTTVTHFHIGLEEGKKWIKPASKMFPPIPPRFKPPANKPVAQRNRPRVRNS